MSSPELENLVATGQLKREPFAQDEFDGLVQSGKARLVDAAYESRYWKGGCGLDGVMRNVCAGSA